MLHRLVTPSCVTLALALGLGFTPRQASCAWPHDPLANVQIAPAGATQYQVSATSDGAGGAIFAWTDQRNGFSNNDIFAQHITALGTVAGGWPAAGLPICSAAGNQVTPVIVSDGAGGAIIAWSDARGGNTDIYAMRVTGAGTFPGGWPGNGVQLHVDTHDELNPVITSDGAGGAIVAWEYVYNPGVDYDIYGGRVNASGTLIWSGSLYSPIGFQDSPSIVSDGAGGAIVSFEDDLSGNYDIEAVRYNAAGSTVWGSFFSPQVAVSVAASDQNYPVSAPDGAGGAMIAWIDYRFAGADILAQHLTAGGTSATGWSVTGNMVCVQPGVQSEHTIISDGAGGAIIAWADARSDPNDVYAQRVLPGGYPAPGWPANGLAVGFGNDQQLFPTIAPDASGGAIIAWKDTRNDPYGDIYAARVTSAGATAPGWSYGGTPLSIAPVGQQQKIAAVADGAGGAIVAWADYRFSLTVPVTFAQNVDRFGKLGDARPAFASLRDVAADQGGRVRMVWNASYLDADPQYAIGSYWIWRQTPASVALAAVRAGGAWLAGVSDAGDGALVTGGRRLFRPVGPEMAGYAWEYLASQPSNGSAQYSYVASTVSDSIAGHNPYTVFMVEARYASGGAFWDSAPESAYSVDNLPPAMPAPFTGSFAGGTTHLHWGPNREADFAVSRLYRGSSAGFVPGPSNFVAEKPDTGFADTGPAGGYYKLAAVDAHGNVSPYALLGPSGTLGVDGQAEVALSLALPAPDPVHSEATFRFALPRAEWATLALYDAAGRLVRALTRGELAAGEHVIRWDGRDREARVVAGGLYFLKLDAEGRSLVQRFAVVR